MKKKNLILAIIIVVILIVVVGLMVFSAKNNPKIGNGPEDLNNNSAQNLNPEDQNADLINEAETPLVIDTSKIPDTLGALPGSKEAPKQEVVEAGKIPAGSIKLEVSNKGFTPEQFKLKPNQEVSLALTNTSTSTHVFIFLQPELMGLTTMLLSGETKVVNFTAPGAGSFIFRDDIPSFRENKGKMIIE